jgi:RHS repeat-associated protein
VDRNAGTYATNRYDYNNANFPHYITEIINANGVPTVRTLYDDSGRMIGMIDADGRTNSFVHDTVNRREIHYDRSGQPTYYTYDTQGNITGTMDALGHTNSFAFDANGYLTNSVDALGHVTSFSNDASGNVLSVTVPYPAGADPANYVTSFTWDQYGNQTSVKLPSGGIVTNVFDPTTGNLLVTKDEADNVISSTTYNAAGLPSSEADKLGTNCFGYDSAGNPTSFTNSLGKVATNGFDANGNLTAFNDASGTSTVNYDAMDRQTSANYGNGLSASYGYQNVEDWSTVSSPTLGNLQRNTDDQGRVSGWTTANGSTPGFAYDACGRMEYETNSIGVVTRSVYNVVGWLVATTNLTTGAWTAYSYDNAGRKVAVTNALGQVTTFAYWPSGSLMAMTNATGSNYWQFSDAAGACSACGNSGTVTDALGRVTVSVQSSHGLPLQTIRMAYADATGANAATNSVAYLNGLTTPEQDAHEYPASVTDEGGRTRQFGYSTLGQLAQATDLSGATWWTNQFDPNTGMLTNVVSPTGETLGYTYDALNNVQTIRFGDGNWLTNFYNAANRLSGVRLPSGVMVSNLYDFAGRVTNLSSTIGETASFAYNGNDAVTAMTDNTGGTTNRFDAGGRLWGIDYPSGASVRYALDLLDRITANTNKTSAGGTAYVTRYQYDSVGNVTNIIDPFNGQASFTYDQAGRRSTRTLPNGIVTTWQYNWKDQVTNIVHKTGGGTVLASVAYQRAAGGEPTQITREDGTYVVLAYDAALRLTNEVYYSTGGVAQTTNSYGFDASGNRVRLMKGGTTLTNAVSAGYRITAVKNGASTVESYAFDNGGRVTTITRDGATLNLGYNSADQVTAVTNGVTWVTYVQDATGRRTVSTNSAGTVRRLLVAPTPGTDLESPQLIADGSGAMQQGYVYLGDKPMLRYTGSGTAVYYLEDGMGSVIGLAPSSSPSPANTTCLFYDGFGNSRGTNGPAPTIPTSAGGDFRFQGAWLETGSGLYNMRAREYDARLGRFTSRDPVIGDPKVPETLHLYNFANANPFVFSDPKGQEFTLASMSVSEFIDTSLDSLVDVAVAQAKKKMQDAIFQAFSNVAIDQLGNLYPPLGDVWKILKSGNLAEAGRNFETDFKKQVCGAIGANNQVASMLWFYPGIKPNGDAESSGFNCPNISTPQYHANRFYPDFVLSETSPTDANGKSILIGGVKLSGNSLYNQYVKNGKSGQFSAILKYASKHTYTRTAVFLTVFKGSKAKLAEVRALMEMQGLENGTMVVVIAALNR